MTFTGDIRRLAHTLPRVKPYAASCLCVLNDSLARLPVQFVPAGEWDGSNSMGSVSLIEMIRISFGIWNP